MRFKPVTLALIIILLSAAAQPTWPAGSDGVYIEDDFVRLTAEPHTLGSSGWVTFSLLSKQFSGDVDLAWGFTSDDVRPTSPQLYRSHTHEHTRQVLANVTRWIVFNNVSSYSLISIEEWGNHSTPIGSIFNPEFYEVNATLGTKIGLHYTGMVSWSGNLAALNVTYLDQQLIPEVYEETHYDWLPASLPFDKITKSAAGMSVWYILKGMPVQANQTYQLRAWVEIPFAGQGQVSGKYAWGLKRSSDTLQEAVESGRFYFIDPWWDSSWTHRVQLVFNNSASSEALEDFPVRVSLDNSRIDWTYVQEDGDDFWLTDSDGTVLAHEVESFDHEDDRAELWVRVPQINAGSTTDHIFLYYGNDLAASGENITGVWSSDYAMVQHINEEDPLTDSTANDNDGTAFTASYGQDKWANDSLWFDGTNDYVQTYSSGTELDFPSGTNFTVEIWFVPESLSGFNNLVTRYMNCYQLWTLNTHMYARLDEGNVSTWVEGTHLLTIDELSYGAYTYNHSTLLLRTNENTDTWDMDHTVQYFDHDWLIGKRFDGYWFDGNVSRVRIWERALTPSELDYNYANGADATPQDTTGLVAEYIFNETSMETLHDYAGAEENDGSLWKYSASPEQAMIGGGAWMDGSEDYWTVPASNSLDLDDNFTLYALVNTDSTVLDKTFMAKYNATHYNYYLYWWGQKPRLSIYDGVDYVATTTTDQINNGNYVLVTARRIKQDKLAMFLNGTQNGSPTSDITTGSITNNYDVRLGERSSGTPRRWADWIDEWRIVNVAHSDDRIMAESLNIFDNFISWPGAPATTPFTLDLTVLTQGGLPIIGALASVINATLTLADQTNSSGQPDTFNLNWMGPYDLLVTADGYLNYELTFNIENNETWTISMVLEEDIVILQSDPALIVLAFFSIVFSILWWVQWPTSEDLFMGVAAGLIWIVFGLYWMIYTLPTAICWVWFLLGVYIWIQTFEDSWSAWI